MEKKEIKKVLLDKDGRPFRNSVFSVDKDYYAKTIVKELQSSSQGRKVLKSYTQSEVRDLLEKSYIQSNQDKLVEISQTLYRVSAQYRRLIAHFVGMPLYSYIIVNNKSIKKGGVAKARNAYEQIATLAKKMNFKYEFSKLHKKALIQDVAFGYILEDSRSFQIQHIPYEMCRISSITDGVYNYSIDMSYFDNDPSELDYYPNEFRNLYFSWKVLKAGRTNVSNYVPVNHKNAICLKINDETNEVLPFFAGIFDSIFEVDGFKKLRRTKGEMENYMTVVQSLPIREDTDQNNDFTIDTDMMMYFHDQLADSVPDNVGVVTTPMAIEAIAFNKNRVGDDGVAQAERDMWSSAGVSSLLFNSDGATSQGLLNSIKTDEELIFSYLRQIEKWTNNRIRNKHGINNMEVSFLDATVFNKEELAKSYLEANTYGFGFKTSYQSVIGLQPIEQLDMNWLENEVLEMNPTTMIPLSSSHTQSGKDTGNGGAPEKDIKEKSDEANRSGDKPNTEET